MGATLSDFSTATLIYSPAFWFSFNSSSNSLILLILHPDILSLKCYDFPLRSHQFRSLGFIIGFDFCVWEHFSYVYYEPICIDHRVALQDFLSKIKRRICFASPEITNTCGCHPQVFSHFIGRYPKMFEYCFKACGKSWRFNFFYLPLYIYIMFWPIEMVRPRVELSNEKYNYIGKW